MQISGCRKFSASVNKQTNKKIPIMEPIDCCRICFDEGQYNIFNDELCFDEHNISKNKIYIVLNNFLYEKVRKKLNTNFLIFQTNFKKFYKSACSSTQKMNTPHLSVTSAAPAYATHTHS